MARPFPPQPTCPPHDDVNYVYSGGRVVQVICTKCSRVRST